jgi:hypothetical protein
MSYWRKTKTRLKDHSPAKAGLNFALYDVSKQKDKIMRKLVLPIVALVLTMGMASCLVVVPHHHPHYHHYHRGW